jgi:hypothetical protein
MCFVPRAEGLAKGVNQSVKVAWAGKLHNTPFVVFLWRAFRGKQNTGVGRYHLVPAKNIAVMRLKSG